MQQNRPVNSQIVADMLQKSGVKKTMAQKILDGAASSGLISFKDYGKQRIYLARQDQLQIPTPEELEAMKKGNEALISEVKSSKQSCGELEAGDLF